MKIIHCADLHLDSKMESNLASGDARLRRDELLDTFGRMVTYAAENAVRAIIIAGDLFDKQHIRKTARMRVLEEIELHPLIDFIYLKGNHDYSDFLDGVETMPENLKLFSDSEWTSYTYDDVVITGREITEDNVKTISTNLILDSAMCNIVVLHGQESEYEGKDKTPVVTLPDFRDKYIDYMALGHIHYYKLDKLDDRGVWCYSGTLEGRGFDECGAKGFVLLNIEDKRVIPTFVPFAKRLLHEVEVELGSEDQDMPAIMGRISSAVEGIPEKDLVKVVLTGRIPMNTDIDLPRIRRSFDENFFFFKVQDRTRTLINYESFANDRSLKGAFVRLVRDKDIPEKEKEKIIEIGMKALMGEEL